MEEQLLTEEEIKEKVKTLTPEEAYQKWIEDSTVQKNLKETAAELSERFGTKWFGFSQLMKKTRFKELETAKTLMNLLCMSDHAGTRNDRKMLEFRMIENKRDKADIIQIQIDFLREKIESLEKQKERYLA